MIFSIVIILFVGLVAYFHFMQGFFSATISAICAILAAVLAVSYHEPVVAFLLRGKITDSANTLILVSLFSGIYLILRTIFDAAIPGQIRLPAIVDQVGGAAMGVVAGIFGAGIFAIAAQALPFGPSIAGYSRWPLAEQKDVQVPPIPGQSSSSQDASVIAELEDQTFDPAKEAGMWIPADDIVMNLVGKLSDGGSLAGQTKLATVHPDYIGELFGQRLGVQVGASRTLFNIEGKTPQAKLDEPGAFRLQTLNQVDAELGQVRGKEVSWPKPLPNQAMLVLRIMFSTAASEKDGLVRISPAMVRLVAKEKNYYPIGTLENGNLLYANKPDDTLFIQTKDADRGADFVFVVPEAEVLVGQEKEAKIANGVFVEVKRMVHIDLSGKPVGQRVPVSKNVEVLRKPAAGKAKPKAGGAAPAPTPGAKAPFVFASAQAGAQLFSALNVNTSDADANNLTLPWGTASLKEKKFNKLKVNTTQTLKLMSTGSYVIADLYEPPGKKVIQVIGTPPVSGEEGGDPWAWASNLQEFALVDDAGNQIKPNGAFGKVSAKQSDRMAGAYNSDAPVASVDQEEGRPTDVWIFFVVPSGTHLKQFTFKGQEVGTVEQVVP